MKTRITAGILIVLLASCGGPSLYVEPGDAAGPPARLKLFQRGSSAVVTMIDGRRVENSGQYSRLGGRTILIQPGDHEFKLIWRSSMRPARRGVGLKVEQSKIRMQIEEGHEYSVGCTEDSPAVFYDQNMRNPHRWIRSYILDETTGKKYSGSLD
ncbi:hypothetical protein JW777_03760 [bacterium]|nr:hypothetical protein [bacterium]